MKSMWMIFIWINSLIFVSFPRVFFSLIYIHILKFGYIQLTCKWGKSMTLILINILSFKKLIVSNNIQNKSITQRSFDIHQDNKCHNIITTALQLHYITSWWICMNGDIVNTLPSTVKKEAVNVKIVDTYHW